MKKFYFVGGPKEGLTEKFFRRLGDIGGPPSGWHIYPHANNDGKALHIVEAETISKILEHLQHFEGIYDRGEIIEIISKN